jgi:hypothetical protein
VASGQQVDGEVGPALVHRPGILPTEAAGQTGQVSVDGRDVCRSGGHPQRPHPVQTLLGAHPAVRVRPSMPRLRGVGLDPGHSAVEPPLQLRRRLVRDAPGDLVIEVTDRLRAGEPVRRLDHLAGPVAVDRTGPRQRRRLR